MKYLYIFKKRNGDLFLDEETAAYKHIYQNHNYDDKFEYIGRIESDEYLILTPSIQDKLKAYKDSLMTPEISKALDDGARSGAFTQTQADYAKKVNDYAIELEKERMESIVLLAKKDYPDKNLNVSTPGGNRDHILGQIR